MIRRDLVANACSSVAHERPRSEIVNDRKQSDSYTDMYACAPISVSVTTQNGGRSLDVLPASRRLDRGSKQSSTKLLLPFSGSRTPHRWPPKDRPGPLCFKDATPCLFSHLNLVLSGFAPHKGDLGLSTFGYVHWSVVGEVAPPVLLGPG